MDYEQKAKAYDEALERARMILCNIPYGSASINDIETIFPQLKESEDEKARRIILELPFKHEADYKFVKDWLEKQKEQKYTNSEKPKEWSEEDENALNFIHELISYCFAINYMDAQTAADMQEWLNNRLKSLRPQPKTER